MRQVLTLCSAGLKTDEQLIHVEDGICLFSFEQIYLAIARRRKPRSLVTSCMWMAAPISAAGNPKNGVQFVVKDSRKYGALPSLPPGDQRS
jgi:hypothetical protein